MIPAGAGLPRHVPRGVRPQLDTLLGLRRYGAEMRRLLAIGAERHVGPLAPTARTQGMDYAESRLYTAGDDVRRIDWRVTARTGRTHTKLYQHERGNDLYCLVDQRAPMRFGTRAAFKSVAAAEIAALAGWAAQEGGDRFGALVAGASGASIRTGTAEGAAPALCAALVAEPAGGEAALDALAARAAGDATVGTRFVVVSDFADDEETTAHAIRLLRARGDLVLVWVCDPLEMRLPPPARYPLTDGREHLVLDTAPPGVRAAHARDVAARRERLARFAAQPGTRCHAVQTGEELFGALERPFLERALA
ncbi:MAG: DUF58 domain-containing protein [Betaproteobacteria bacterium]|nr:DUF58 domain-containing protein [Betaproteobacteria bacterium]